MGVLIYALIAAPFFLAIDLLWLGVLARRFYERELGDLRAPRPKFTPAAIFYVFYLLALSYFAIVPAIAAGSLPLALLNGAFLGLTAYGTYDLVNRAVIRGWPLRLTIVDMGWGTALSAAVAGLAYGTAILLGLR